MADRAALITGGSSGIGLAIARALGREGFALTVSARRPDKLEEAVNGLVAEGIEAQAVPANMTEEQDILRLRDAHRDRFGRLDVLVNNAGVGIGGPIEDHQTKHLDIEIGANLRATYIMLRESIPMLKEAASERGQAYIVNVASIAGKEGQGWLGAYSATKAGIVALSQAAHAELATSGIKVTALCPAFVATPMTEWMQGQIPPEEMIAPEDIAEAVLFLLRTSRHCVIPEIQFIRPGDNFASSG